MGRYDWSRFSQRIRIKAPLNEVYQAWATGKGLERSFLRMVAFTTPEGRLREEGDPVAPGDRYHWRWHGYPDQVEEFGEILEANGKDRLRFVFGKAGIVTVQLKGNETETDMEITQEEIPVDEEGKINYHIGCATGWTFYRANMKAVLEGGVDVRNIGNDSDHND